MKIKTLLIAAYILVIGIGVWQVVPAVQTNGRTGVLDVSTSSSSAQLSISQDNTQAAVIGTGSAQVRLSPGTYQVVATDSGNRASAVVEVYAGSTTHTSLKLSSSTSTSNTGSSTTQQHVRTVQDINFEGMDALSNSGLTTTQINDIEQYFFNFKSSANTISIDTSTVQTAPRDPNIISPSTLDFTVDVDSTAYRGAASYMDLNNVQLQLFDTTSGARVFTAGTTGS